MVIDKRITPRSLLPAIERMWELSGRKIRSIAEEYDEGKGSPVYTIDGRYTNRGWTEWTRGFMYGSPILQFDATGDEWFLDYGIEKTLTRMTPHLTHFGVHDHGFNIVSTYGNLLRLLNEGRVGEDRMNRNFLELALKVSSAVQAKRWTALPSGGYIYSFNGPHSLFADTIRSLRILALGHALGHELLEEGDRKMSLLARLVQHAVTTAKYTVFYGTGRDAYDVRGRVAHECIFNLNDGGYRCPNSQQGYSPFSTWTRGLAWVICGYAEQLAFFGSVDDAELEPLGGRAEIERIMRRAAMACADFYIDNTATDGIPYWDTGAPGLARLGDWRSSKADPYNAFEPVDSSAAAIAAQGLLRLGDCLGSNSEEGRTYRQAGLTALATLLDEPYLSVKEQHQGLLLHSVYHRPNGWDHVPEGKSVPCDESSMWGDYHLREAALLVQRDGELEWWSSGVVKGR